MWWFSSLDVHVKPKGLDMNVTSLIDKINVGILENGGLLGPHIRRNEKESRVLEFSRQTSREVSKSLHKDASVLRCEVAFLLKGVGHRAGWPLPFRDRIERRAVGRSRQTNARHPVFEEFPIRFVFCHWPTSAVCRVQYFSVFIIYEQEK
jgi:hypothetical protein